MGRRPAKGTPPVTAGRLLRLIGGLGAVTVAVGAGSVALAGAGISPGEVGAVLVGQVLPVRQTWSDATATVILRLRLPRTLLAALVGGSLAVAGAAFQGITRNPLADPSILGISSGAAFGVVLTLALGMGKGLGGLFGLSTAAFLGAVASAVAVYLIARVNGHLPVQNLLLAGVIASLFFSSAITLVTSLRASTELPEILFWLMGNLGPASPGDLALLAGLGLLGGGIVLREARNLNALTLGEEAALQLGVEGERVKRVIFVAAALLTGAAVAQSGSIGFIGLIVPHTARMLFGADHRILVPSSALLGASFLMAADALARTVAYPGEIPVGVLTALCGAPFFVALLRRRTRGPLW